jgi:hypothetical protein
MVVKFFPNAQLFGFTGTPIFEQNATSQQRDGTQASFKTTKDIFQNELHVALCFSMNALTMACLIVGLFLVGLSAVSG